MTIKSATPRQTEATRLLKAAKAAGFARARLITYPDGRIELIGEAGVPEVSAVAETSPFEKWKAENANKN